MDDRAGCIVFFPFVGGNGTVGGSHISALKLAHALKAGSRYRPLLGVHRPGGPLAALISDYGLEASCFRCAGSSIATGSRTGAIRGGSSSATCAVCDADAS